MSQVSNNRSDQNTPNTEGYHVCFPIDFHLLFDQLIKCVVVFEKIDNEGDFIFSFSNTAAEKTECFSSNCIGVKFSEHRNFINQQALFNVLTRVWETGEPENQYVDDGKEALTLGFCSAYVYKISRNHLVVIFDTINIQDEYELEEKTHSNLTTLFMVAPIGLGIVTNRVFLDVNQKFCDLVGYSHEELIGQSSMLVYPDEQTYYQAGESKYLQISKFGIGSVETQLQRKDGTIVNVILSSTPLNDKKLTDGVMFTVQDITERIKSELTISKAKEEWETTFDTMADMVTIHDSNKQIVRVNKAAADFIQAKPGETIGKSYCQLFWGHDVSCDGCPMDNTIACGAEESKFIEHVQHGKILSVSTSPITSNSDRQLYIHVARDVTEQKQQEQILAARFRLSQSPEGDSIHFFLRQALDEAQQLTGSQIGALYLVDKDQESLTLQAWSDQAFKEMCEIFSKSKNSSNSKIDLLTECINQQKSVFYNDYKSTINQKEGAYPYVEIFRKLAVPIFRDDVVVAIACVGNKVTPYSEADANAVEQLFDLAWDIVVRKKAVEALKKSEEQLRTFIDASPDAICLKDGEGRWLRANSEWIKMLQLQGITYLGKTDKELAYIVNPDYRDALLICDVMDQYAWEAQKEYRSTQIIKLSGHSEKIYDIIKKPLYEDGGEKKGIIVIARDVTEQKKLQQEASRSSRLAAIGELAAGVAHEINNPNALTLYNSEILEALFNDLLPVLESGSLNDDFLGGLPFVEGVEEIKQLLPTINDSARRIKRIVDDLRDFARQDQTVHGEQVDINSVVQASLRLVHNTIMKSTDCLEVDLYRQIPLIAGEKSRIEQVVINLLVNACQALEDRSQKIVVRTLLDPTSDTIKVVVADEGCGISAENIEHIQDPFMTTKREAGGSGLGLSVSSRIVQEHGGTLDFKSVEGEGTQVIMSLPHSTKHNQGER
jgi:PAS domain S-box-containing protein